MDKFTNIEAEASILGSIILNNNFLPSVEDILEPKHFYLEIHQKLYEYMLKADGLITYITLKPFFEKEEQKDYAKILLEASSSLFTPREYSRLIIELWKKREAYYLIHESLEALESEKFGKTIAKLENDLAKLETTNETTATKKAIDIAREIDLRIQQGIKPRVIPTKIDELDNTLVLGGGLFSKRLYVVSAGAGTGKTSLGLQFMITAEEQGKKTCFISMEMSADEATNKIISHLKSVPLWKLQRGIPLNQVEEQGKQEALQLLENYNLSINDSPSVSPSQIERILKRELEQKSIQLLVVDYIQIMAIEKDKNKLMAELIKQNSTALKNIAKKYDVAVVLLSQIKRNDNKKPTLEDIKGSGGIGEDADMVIALYCENPKEKIKEVEFLINKNRWGKMTDFVMDFDGEFGRFIKKENSIY